MDSLHSRRYSRRGDRNARRKTAADLVFRPFTKVARYRVNIGKPRGLTGLQAHDRSFRHEDINMFIMTPNQQGSGFDGFVRLDDFFDGEVSRAASREFKPKVRRVKGLSVTVSEGFIDERKWWRKIFGRRDRLARDSPRQSQRTSWVGRLQMTTFQRRRNEPEYTFTTKDVFDIFGDIVDNSNRVGVGINLTRKVFGFRPTQQEHFNRPFFTAYITLLQLLLFIGIIATHGIAPIGFAFKTIQEPVLMPDLNTRLVVHYELMNFWIGPRQADMIRIGAKFSPCIKPDKRFDVMRNSIRRSVNTSGCCVFYDGRGCIQNDRKFCSGAVADWRESKVCGQDPNYCLDDVDWNNIFISDWPVCDGKTRLSKDITSMGNDTHMSCELVGRPCCVGLLGECIMTTREYCLFKRGIFHQYKYLCTQVDCLYEICGMLPFAEKNKPDQFYRFFTSLLIIPGILALVICILFQIFVMYDLERLTGTFEMSVLYLVCGVGGSALSCIFMPYYVEAGPSGSHFGVLAALIVEIIRWNVQEKPKLQFFTCLIFLFVLFMIGLIVPQVDNWAHLAGLIIGIFIAVAFRPIRQLRKRKIKPILVKVQVVLGAVFSVALFSTVLLVYYLMKEPIHCPACLYFNCLPISDDYCEGMSVNLYYNSILLSYDEW